MTTVYFNEQHSDDERRAKLYNGDLYVYAPSPATQALCQLARDLCENAFAPWHPVEAQHHLAVEEYNEILKEVKPRFVHHPRGKELISQLLEEHGCDLTRTYFDVPRLRTATAGDYLNSGLAYVFKPHRDTWYSSPMCQLNWWLPVYEIASSNGMAFYPQYWNTPVLNSSAEFNYQDWNQTGRKQAYSQGKQNTCRQSEALETLSLDPDLRLVTESGGMIVFSAAHLHGTVTHTTKQTRISIDFRTVHLSELETDSGAPNLDSRCAGTTIHDYLNASTLSHIPEELRARFEESTRPRPEVSVARIDQTSQIMNRICRTEAAPI